MKFFKISIGFLLLVISTSNADVVNNQIVTGILIEPPTGVLVNAQNADGTGAAQYAFDLGTDAEFKKAMISLLLTSVSSGQKVQIYYSVNGFNWYTQPTHKINAVRIWKQ